STIAPNASPTRIMSPWFTTTISAPYSRRSTSGVRTWDGVPCATMAPFTQTRLGRCAATALRSWVVLKRMSYIGHGLSHAIFGGAAVAYVLGWNFYLGAGAWGVLSALLINGVARRRKIGADAAIGVVTTASFAIGVALISSVHRFAINLEAALFGNILGVTHQQLLVLLGVLVVTGGAIFLGYRQLLFATFDPEASDAYGVSSRRAETLIALLLAATIVASMQALGVTL